MKDVEKEMSIRKVDNLHKVSNTTLQRQLKSVETSFDKKGVPEHDFL